MARLAPTRVILMIICLLASVPWWAHGSHAVSWAKKTSLEPKKKTVTNLQFYFHDILSGQNPTAIRVAQAAGTDKSPTLFGVVMMADDPLTETPDPKSKLLGRAQGIYASAGQEELGLLMAMNFGFYDGKYNGSSISILGKNNAVHPVREMPIVGGTGIFRLARGYAVAKTYWFDAKTGDAIVGYNVTVIH
ncbi:dirigent protein 23-like [Carica papaya]|uniref:dirigent protein 23-like n=1 Tax=Carica papaya TaxID=3649 RepID=UPI000B8CEE18|nr:dirigent protein 23-like [Carica papaya]